MMAGNLPPMVFLYYFFSVYKCFVHMYVCAHHACLVPAKEGFALSGNRVIDGCELPLYGCLQLNLGPL